MQTIFICITTFDLHKKPVGQREEKSTFRSWSPGGTQWPALGEHSGAPPPRLAPMVSGQQGEEEAEEGELWEEEKGLLSS